MSLYTEPPTGIISCQKLEKYTLKRLDFLLKVLAARGNQTKLHQIVCDSINTPDSDCLIGGSVKDKVSHFSLRLLMGGDPETQQFFEEAETAWFDFKFSCLSEHEMKQLFYSVDRVLKKNSVHTQGCNEPAFHGGESVASILHVFRSIRQSAGSWKDVIRLYMTQCSSLQFSVPFQSVLSLVRKRQVMLDRGTARVPWCKLREVVTEQFSSLMQLASVQASRQFPAAVADDRLRLLWRKMKHIYRRWHPASLGVGLVPGLPLDQVDAMAKHYPLCMSTLLRSLRQKHRLGHHARIQLTLFLKDLGLPVHHALALWRQEYSRPRGEGSGCAHSWQTDGRRYTYSIRHLYGLEGAHRNYGGHCCDSLQQRVVGCNEEGGCPFSHWDNRSLSAELSALGLCSKDVANIVSLCEKGLFSAACHQSLRIISCTQPAESENSDQWSKREAEAQSCHQLTIPSSPHDSYHADCSKNQVCDVEDLLDTHRVKSAQSTAKSPSTKDGSPSLAVTAAEKKQSGTSCGIENMCEGSHNSRASPDIHCEHPVCIFFPCKLESKDVTFDVSSSCMDQVNEYLQSTNVVFSEGQGVECFEHEVCPSQSQEKHAASTSSIEPSIHPVIFRPVHYVHISYNCLLQGLRS